MLYLRFTEAITLNCSSFVWKSWGLRDRPVFQNTDLWHKITIPPFWKWNLSICYISQLEKKEHTSQKMKFSMKDFFSKCDEIRSFMWMWSHLLKKSLRENFIFCAVIPVFKNTSLWLLLAGKHLCWSLFLILSIAKCLRARILKNICERLLLWKYVQETEKNWDLFIT